MRILLLVLSLMISNFPQYSLSAEITMAECNTTIAELNASLPMELDEVTTWVNTTCVDQSNGAIQLVYNNRVKAGNTVTQQNLNAIRPGLIMSWCSGPNLLPLIQSVDTINYQYSFENGQNIGELAFSYSDCSSAP